MRKYFIFFITLFLTFNSAAATFIDDLAGEIRIDQPPRRIISLAPSVTENLFALGVGEYVVGVTRFCNYPPQVTGIAKIGDFSSPNLEAIISLQPDLIVATADGNDKNKVDKLRTLGYPIYIQNATSLAETLTSLEKLGNALGRGAAAQTLVKDLRQQQMDLLAKIKDKKSVPIFFEIGTSLWTISNETFLGDLLQKAGGENIVGADLPARYAMVNVETVIARQPQVIIISSMANAEQLPALKQEWQKWTTIPAVKNKRIYIIQSDIVNRAGPRIIDALAELIEIIHFRK